MIMANQDNGELIASDTRTAYSFFKRLRGLLFTEELPDGCAMHIQPCSSIHTFFMNYAIDVLYLDQHGMIVGMEEHLQPGKTGKRWPQVASVVELPIGKIKKSHTKLGHTIEFKKIEMKKEIITNDEQTKSISN